MAKVIGLGGIFLKFNDPGAMRAWYRDMLGMETNDYGVLFEFNGDTHVEKGYMQLGTFDASTNYFGSDSQQAMLNFRVDDLNGLAEKLRSASVAILNEIEEYSYGKFLHISDPEGNRLELWEPIDSEFGSSGSSMPMK